MMMKVVHTFSVLSLQLLKTLLLLRHNEPALDPSNNAIPARGHKSYEGRRAISWWQPSYSTTTVVVLYYSILLLTMYYCSTNKGMC